MEAFPAAARNAAKRWAAEAGHEIALMLERATHEPRDWISGIGTYTIAWGLPHFAIIAALLASVPARAAIWTVALVWMGAACLMNARRCGRTHCRFTGPYYLVMIVPVIVLASGLIAAEFTTWLALAGLILLGSKMIWWMSERAFGKFS